MTTGNDSPKHATGAILKSADDEMIQYGMLRWEPRSLPTVTLRRILTDVAADLWGDCWRVGERDDRERVQRFSRIVETLLYAATGEHWSVKRQ